VLEEELRRLRERQRCRWGLGDGLLEPLLHWIHRLPRPICATRAHLGSIAAAPLLSDFGGIWGRLSWRIPTFFLSVSPLYTNVGQ
jgi:hypothetical protein